MGSGVADAVAGIELMGQESTLAALKGELQNPHSGEVKLVAKRYHFGRNQAQILCENGKIVAQLFLDGQKQIRARSLFPLAGYGCLSVHRNLPIGLEAPEMVDAHIIHLVKLMLYPVDPPTVALFFMFLPVVERIAPLLAGSAEIVGRNACHCGRITLGIHLEQLPVGPYVGAVGGYEDGNIAYDGNAFVVGIFFQRIPLGIEHKLQESLIMDAHFQFLLPECPVLLIQIPQGLGPFGPGEIVLLLLQGHVEAVIGEPVLVFLAEFIVVFLKIRILRLFEALKGLLIKGILVFAYPVIIHLTRVEIRNILQVVLIQ